MIYQTPDTINPNTDETGHAHTWCDPEECAAGYRARFVDIGNRYGAAVIEQQGSGYPTLTLPKMKIDGPADRVDLSMALAIYDKALAEHNPRTARNVRTMIEDVHDDELMDATPCVIEYSEEDGLDGWNNTAEAAHWLATGGVERTPEAALRAFLTGDPHGTVCDVDEEVLDDELVDAEDVVCWTTINVDGITVEAHHGMTAGEARALGCLLLHSARTLEQIEDGE